MAGAQHVIAQDRVNKWLQGLEPQCLAAHRGPHGLLQVCVWRTHGSSTGFVEAGAAVASSHHALHIRRWLQFSHSLVYNEWLLEPTPAYKTTPLRRNRAVCTRSSGEQTTMAFRSHTSA
jgi:hypothetical protein